MFRRLDYAVGFASLLLCVAACALWARSYWINDKCVWNDLIQHHSSEDDFADFDSYRSVLFRSGRGLFTIRTGEIFRQSNKPMKKWQFFTDHENTSWPDGKSMWNRLGFEYYYIFGDTEKDFHAPAWAPALVMALVAAGPWSFRWAGRRRNLARLQCKQCPSCGYDLRATPDCCPECGTVFAKV